MERVSLSFCQKSFIHSVILSFCHSVILSFCQKSFFHSDESLSFILSKGSLAHLPLDNLGNNVELVVVVVEQVALPVVITVRSVAAVLPH